MKTAITVLLALGALLAPPAVASAAEPAPSGPAEVRPAFPGGSLEIEPYLGRLFSARLRGDPGRVEADYAGLAVRGRVPVLDGAVLGLDGLFEARDYAFDDPVDFPAGGRDPFRSLLSFEAGLSWRQPLGDGGRDDWQLFARTGVRESREAGADAGEGLTWSGLFSAGREFAPGFRLGFGLAASSRLEDDARVFPALEVAWEISPGLTARIEGPELALELEIDDATRVAFLAGYESRRYRLRDRGAAPEGVFSDERVPLSLRLSRDLAPGVVAELTVGLDAWREIELLDDRGHHLGRARSRPAPAAGLAIRVRF